MDKISKLKMKIVRELKSIKRFVDWTSRHFLIKEDFGQYGANTIIENPCHVESPESVFLEENVRLRNNLSIINAPTEKVIVKRYTVIAGGVTIITNSHISTVGVPHFLLGISHINDKSADVVIDEDVWVGANSTILAGVHLGRGCIVSAGALVTKTVPPYALVVGVPAKIVKSKFTIDQILKHETILYPPEQRMTREELESIFSEFFKGKGTYGMEKDLSKNEKEKLENMKKKTFFIDWKQNRS